MHLPASPVHRLAGASLAACLLVGACASDGDDASSSSATTERSQTTTAATEGALPVDELTTVVDETVTELGVPGAAVLVVTPAGRFEHTVGVADLDSEAPVEPGMRWPLRSITKAYTVTVLLQLADEGLVDLDDTIDTWVDDVPNGDQVTLRQLADMTAGLPDYTTEAFIDDFVADPTREFTDDELIAYALAEPAVAEPGAEAVYTNTNTLLLGAVVEDITGQPFAEVIQERVLDPEGLTETVYPTSSADWTDDAVGYQPDDEGGLAAQPVNFSVFGPAGALIATTDDLAAFGPILGGGSLLDPETQADRLVGAPLDDGPEYDQYAVGIGELDGWWGHTGEGFGFTALVMYDEGSESTVVIVMNAAQLETHAPTTLFRRMAPLLG